MTTRPRDQRQFGRRRSLIHAFIVTERGGRATCLVRNISAGGALLEVELPQLVPQRMKLIVDADDFEADCELRHRNQFAVGVYFRDVRIGQRGVDTRFAGPALEDTMRTIKLTDIARR